MNYQNFLRTRRSIRRFKPDFIPMPVIERVLETATFAPSAHNLQPWRFAIIQTDSAKTALGKALTDKLRLDMSLERIPQADIDLRIQRSLQRIGEAPLIILLCRDVTAVRKEVPEEHAMALQSVALAGLQLMLAAHAEGLGASWICWPLYAQKAVQDALNLPGVWEPQGMFFIGFADEEPKKRAQTNLDEFIMVL